MPKKQGKGKKKAEPEKPFTFDINNFKVERTAPGLLRLMPVIPPGFQEVAFKLKITKNLRTGKPNYDIVYYECKVGKKADGDTRDLGVFSVTIPETGKTLLIDPKKTQGNPPFHALDPITNKEEVILHPLIIHHDKASGRNFVLDITKFDGGKLEFKDAQTRQTYTADLTKRVDPLKRNVKERDDTDKETEVKFLGLIRNGNNYVVQSEDTGNIQILDYNGRVLNPEEYDTKYDAETDTTMLIEYVDNEEEETDNGNGKGIVSNEVLLTIPGKVELDFPERSDADTDSNVEGEITKKFEKVHDPITGQIAIVNDEGKPVEYQLNEYYVFENPNTNKLEVFNSKGEFVELPQFKLGKDETDKTILVTMTGEPLADVVEGLADMIIVNEKDLRSTRKDNRVNSKKKTGSLSSKPGSSGNRTASEVQQVTSGEESEIIDPNTGQTMKSNRRGIPGKQSSDRNERGDGKHVLEGVRDKMDTSKRSRIAATPVLSKIVSQETEEQNKNAKSKEEKYFATIDYEEARTIVEQVNTATETARPILLRVIMEVIEVNKELIMCALEQKKKVEKNFALILMEEKKKRQHQYIKDIKKAHAQDQDKHIIQEKILRKMGRENELLFETLDVRITAENKALISVINESISKDSKKVIRYTNIPCYRNFKLIVFKDMMKFLEEEIDQLKREVCEIMNDEKESIFNENKSM